MDFSNSLLHWQMTSRNVKWAQLFYIFKIVCFWHSLRMPFSFLWFFSSEDAQCCKKIDHLKTIREMSFNWHECRGWLGYKAVFSYIYTDQTNSIAHILQEDLRILQEKKIWMISRKKILCWNTVSTLFFLTMSIIPTQCTNFECRTQWYSECNAPTYQLTWQHKQKRSAGML